MKKTYMMPKTDMVRVQLQHMVAVSSGDSIQFKGDGTGSVETQSEGAVSSAMGHSSSIWDDEE